MTAVSKAPRQAASSLRATPAGAHLGAEIHGADLSQPLSDAAFEQILGFFNTYAVIFFRGQHMTADTLAAFSARFGPLDIHHMTEHVFPHLPQVRVLSNVKEGGQPIGIAKAGMHWHSDLSYKPVPALATLLYGVECPPEGADTQFVNMSVAYARLPESLRQKTQGRRAVHDRNFRYSALYPNRPPLTAEQVSKVPPSEHPLIHVHPATKKPTLFVAKDVVSRIVGMDEREGRALIDALEEAATQPELIYSHKWQPGDVLVWDNRCTLHRATPFDNKYKRTLYRTQVKGTAPVPA